MSDEAERVWDLMERFPLCTLATWDGNELHAAPMSAFVRRRNEAIYLLVDVVTYSSAAIRAYPDVALSFADSATGQIVSVSGTAQMSADRAVIRELWSTSARHFWATPDDPHIRMLRVTPREAKFRDGDAIRTIPMRAKGAGAGNGNSKAL